MKEEDRGISSSLLDFVSWYLEKLALKVTKQTEELLAIAYGTTDGSTRFWYHGVEVKCTDDLLRARFDETLGSDVVDGDKIIKGADELEKARSFAKQSRQ